MGFTTPPNISNKHNKDNTFWYPDQHSKVDKTLTEMACLRQLLPESRFIDLSDISRKLTKLGRCLLVFFFFKEEKLMGNEHKRLYEASQELSSESILGCSSVYTMKTLNQTSVSNMETFSDANSLIAP